MLVCCNGYSPRIERCRIRVSKCGVMHVRTNFMLQLYDFQIYRNILGMDKESSCMTVLNPQQIDQQNSTSDCSATTTPESTLIIFVLPSPLFVLCSWLPHQADLFTCVLLYSS